MLRTVELESYSCSIQDLESKKELKPKRQTWGFFLIAHKY